MPEDLTGLSPEEIAAIKEDNDNLDEGEGADVDADSDNNEGESDSEDGSGDDPSDEGGSDSGDADGKKDEKDRDPAEKSDKKDEQIPDADDSDASEQRLFAPQFKSADEEHLAKLKSDLDAAKKQFDDGDVDFAKFSEAKDLYNAAKWKADFVKEANVNMADERWRWEQERFLDDNQIFRDNATLNAAFVSSVNHLIASKEGESLGDREILIKAKGLVEADLLVLTASVGNKTQKDSAKEKVIAAAKKGKGDRSKIPADIKDAPSAEENNEVAEFAFLDKLSGEKYQEAIDKMTPTQLEKYENEQE